MGFLANILKQDLETMGFYVVIDRHNEWLFEDFDDEDRLSTYDIIALGGVLDNRVTGKLASRILDEASPNTREKVEKLWTQFCLP